MTDKPIGRGTVLAGRFRLEDLVQDTDGARFWRAVDQILARSVAVNVIDTADPRADALLVAARTSATITEGHFLRVLDAAQEDGVVYVVHEWGTGVSLDKMLAEEPLPPRRAAWLVKEVADAITFAHGHGIAHGRLVPENVMVTEAGSVKLIGFVVDAVLHGRRQPATRDGRSLSDHESDVHNLAALLYATLVGKWPGTLTCNLPPAPHEHGRTLRPRQVRAGVPRALDAICDQVLNPSGLGTLETAQEISAALSDFIGDSVTPMTGHEPTVALARGEATGQHRAAVPEDAEPTVPPETTPRHLPEPETGAEAGPETGPEPPAQQDPEATQAAGPLFDDDEPTRRVAPPPPPPFSEPEAKPLFAPGPPRAAVERQDPGGHDTSGAVRGLHSTHGTGSLPPVWGPDADASGSDGGDWGPRDSSRDWLKLAAAVAVIVLLVLAIVFAFNLGRDSGGEPEATPDDQQTTSEAPAEPLPVAAVTDLDPPPDGNGEENPEQTALAVDGDPATAWETMQYFRSPEFGNLKAGVGLVLDLGDEKQVSAVEVTLQGEPYGLQLYAAPEGTGTPTGIAGLQRVAAANGAGGPTPLELQESVTTRYLVVWLTSIPADGDGSFRGRIAEIVVRP